MHFKLSPIFICVSIFIICLIILFIPVLNLYSNATFVTNSNYVSHCLSNNLSWPVPGYTTITSNFGYRVAPTNGASTYHSGIDIAAPTGANIIASFSGEITFLGWYRCWSDIL